MPNPFAIIEHARAKAELERLERKHRSELHRKLDAILERLPAHPDDQRPDCRTCAHVYTDMESYGCKRSVTTIVCINGDGYVPSTPVRLYEMGGGQ